MPRFVDKVAIVTGASMTDSGVGIGGATAIALAREGAKVIIADVLRTGATERLADHITASGGQVTCSFLDQSEEASVIAMIDLAVTTYGTIDILINNAATVPAEDVDVLNTSLATWDRVMGVNARGAFTTIKYALPHMLTAGHGAIVNVSSGSGLLGDSTRVAYGASKGAINTLTKYVATMYGKQGIRCNAICPGLTLSNSGRDLLSPEVLDIFLKQTLTPHLGEPEHLAEAILFLASDAAAFITGIVMSVDGGMLQHQTYSADIQHLMKASVSP